MLAGSGDGWDGGGSWIWAADQEEQVVQVCASGDIGESKFGLPLANCTRFCYVIGPRVLS